LFCPNCGKENVEKAKFCMMCGTNLKNLHYKKQNHEKKIKSNRNKETSNFNLLNKFNNKIKQSRENSKRKKEEKLKVLNDNINYIKSALDNDLKEYKNYLINKTSFEANLKDEYDINVAYLAKDIEDTIFEKTLTREGFCGTITFYEGIIRLLPGEKGKTTDISYHAIRKIKFQRDNIRLEHCNSANLEDMPFNAIEVTFYLHDGNFGTIRIFHHMNNGQYNTTYMELYDDKYLKNLLELNRNKDKTAVLDLYEYAWNIGYDIDLTLKNHIKNLFKDKFNENNLSVIIEDNFKS
jgi:hypothetical protein